MITGYFYPPLDLEYILNKYRMVQNGVDGMHLYDSTHLSIIISGEEHDKKKWLHISAARTSRLPSYGDLKRIKKDFIGEEKRAIMIFPDAAHHVNIHPYCLHLYYCFDGDGLPEFSYKGLL
jgi:hypothetical protein